MHRFDGHIQSGINDRTQNQVVTQNGMHGNRGLLLIRNGGHATDLLSWQNSDNQRFEEQNQLQLNGSGKSWCMASELCALPLATKVGIRPIQESTVFPECETFIHNYGSSVTTAAGALDIALVVKGT
jgi:hypothetical protein